MQSEFLNYIYHNCEFDRALEIWSKSRGIGQVDTDVIAVKSLCELDRAKDAVTLAEQAMAQNPEAGILHYYHGMSHYLSGNSADLIKTSFATAQALGTPAAVLGEAFLLFAEKQYSDAVKKLAGVSFVDQELAHVRLLMSFQCHIANDNLILAQAALSDADTLLRSKPSLLRHHWGQLCWVRFLRAKGDFSGARAVLNRLLGLLDESIHCRLYRNAKVAQELIEKEDDSSQHMNLPPVQLDLEKMASITRKPVLNSLFRYLRSMGSQGATKEQIVQSIWEENYNPLIHDDRIYKAVGRLRKLMDDPNDAPKLLIQTGRHYVLNVSDSATGGKL